MVRSILFNIPTDEYRVGDRVIINSDCSNVYRIVKMEPASKKHDPPECEESCGFFYCRHDDVDCETMVRLTGCLHKGFYFKQERQDDADRDPQIAGLLSEFSEAVRSEEEENQDDQPTV